MYCENCGKLLAEGTKFCNVCGTKQPQPVYCIRCGKKLEPRSMFCTDCGASQMPPAPEIPVVTVSAPLPVIPEAAKPAAEAVTQPVREEIPAREAVLQRKKSIKWLIPVAALVAAMAAAAVFLIPVLFPSARPEEPEETVTVYVLTGQTYLRMGEPFQEYTLEYDDRGNLICIESDDSVRTVKLSLDYDTRGNLTQYRMERDHPAMGKEEFLQCYDYTYDKNGRVEECTVSRKLHGQELTEWYTSEFSYDRQGNLILVENSEGCWQWWQHYQYDDDGRLIQETFCEHDTVAEYDESLDVYVQIVQGVFLKRFTYTYDQEGRVTGVKASRAKSPENLRYYALDGLAFGEYEGYLTFGISYDKHCRITDVGDRQFCYDRDGNPESVEDGVTDTYDDHGNLICRENTSGDRVEYTYEAIQLPAKDAAGVERWKRYANHWLDQEFGFGYMLYHFYLDPAYGSMIPERSISTTDPYYYPFYYYLIPNPIW